MNDVPWWMFVLILYFVYDDIWFTEEDSPIIHYIMVFVLLMLGILLAIGQGGVIKEGVRVISEKLKERFAFLR